MNKKDLMAKENLALIKENILLKEQLEESKQKEEYYSRIVDIEADKAKQEIKRAREIEKESVVMMQKYDELKAFLWKASNLSGKLIIHNNGGGFILDTIPELPMYVSGKRPPRMSTVTRIYVD